MITIGSDVHLKTTTMTVLDDEGKKIMHKRINNEPEQLLTFVRQVEGPKQLAMETCYNWPVFYDLFKDEVDQFHLLHAKKLKAIIESQTKCDKHDADEIAYLTHIGYIPKAYTANAPTRELRRFLRTRIRLSRNIASIKNQIHAIVNANHFYSQRPKNFKDLFCRRGLQYLKKLSLPEKEQFLVERLLQQIQYLENLREQFDTHLETMDVSSPDLHYLETAPAMKGKLIKFVVLAEIDNIHRFKNSDVLIAYAGLCAKDKSSADKNRKGQLRTDCNEFLKWAIIQAVTPAMRRDKGLRAYYLRVKQNYNTSGARIATARKLLRSIYHLLKEQRPYYSELDRR